MIIRKVWLLLVYWKAISFLLQQIHELHKKYNSKKFELKELKTNLVWISKATVTRTTQNILRFELKFLEVSVWILLINFCSNGYTNYTKIIWLLIFSKKISFSAATAIRTAQKLLDFESVRDLKNLNRCWICSSFEKVERMRYRSDLFDIPQSNNRNLERILNLCKIRKSRTDVESVQVLKKSNNQFFHQRLLEIHKNRLTFNLQLDDIIFCSNSYTNYTKIFLLQRLHELHKNYWN